MQTYLSLPTNHPVTSEFPTQDDGCFQASATSFTFADAILFHRSLINQEVGSFVPGISATSNGMPIPYSAGITRTHVTL
jgi:hypothetical protein